VTERSRATLIVIALVALAGALRVLALDKSLYVDEIITLTVASQPLSRMGTVMGQIDASPALFPLLLHGWLLFGHADAWARLLPAVFGIAAVYLVFRVASRAFGRGAGIAAALVAAMAPAHVEYSQYVRSYSLLTCLAGAQILLVIDWFERKRRSPWRILALSLVTTALLYTHYVSMLLLVPEGLIAATMFLRGRRRAALEWATAVLVAGLLFTPGISLLLHNIEFDRGRNEQRPARPPLGRLAVDLAGELTVGPRTLGFGNPMARRATLAGAAVLFPALVVAGVVSGWRQRPLATLTLVLVAVVPTAFFLLSGRRLIAVRFFLPFMVGYLVLLGQGLASLRPRWRILCGTALVVICTVPLAHFFTRFEWGYDHRLVARELEARRQSGDILLFVHPYEQFYYRWYLDDRIPMHGLLFTALENQSYVIKPAPLDFAQGVRSIERLAPPQARFWIIGQSERGFTSRSPDERRLLEWLDSRYDRVADLSPMTDGDPVVRAYFSRGTSR